MHPVVRKVLAVLGGLCVAMIFLYWGFAGSGYVNDLFGHNRSVASTFPDPLYHKFDDLFISLTFLGFALSAGLSFTLLAWERRPPQARIQAMFWLLLFLVMPMSVANYWSEDAFVSRKQQAIIDIVFAFLSMVCVAHLYQVHTSNAAAKILKAMAMFFLMAQGVIVPVLFFILWWVSWIHIVPPSATVLTDGWVSAIAAVGSLVVSAFAYFRPPAPPAASPPPPPSIILPPDSWQK